MSPVLLGMPKPSQCALRPNRNHTLYSTADPPAAETLQRVGCYILSPLLDSISPAHIQALPSARQGEKLCVEDEAPISESPSRCIFHAPDPIWVTPRSPQLLPLLSLTTCQCSTFCFTQSRLQILSCLQLLYLQGAA